MPPRPWSPLADHELYPLLRHFLPQHPQGRRVAELRNRLDAIFWIATRDDPWSALPARFGRPDTVHRWFRRLAHQGVWHRILLTLHDAPAADPIQSLAPWLLRACRRAASLLGPAFVGLIHRLGLTEALPGPPWMLPNRALSRLLHRFPLPTSWNDPRTGGTASRAYLALLIRLHRQLSIRRPMNRRIRFAWC